MAAVFHFQSIDRFHYTTVGYEQRHYQYTSGRLRLRPLSEPFEKIITWLLGGVSRCNMYKILSQTSSNATLKTAFSLVQWFLRDAHTNIRTDTFITLKFRSQLSNDMFEIQREQTRCGDRRTICHFQDTSADPLWDKSVSILILFLVYILAYGVQVIGKAVS